MVEGEGERPAGFELITSQPDEIHDTLERVFRARCRFEPQGSGYRALLRHQTLGALSFTTVSHGAAVDIATEPLHGGFLVQIPAAGGWRTHARAPLELRGPLAQVIAPGASFGASLADDMRMLVVRLDEHAVNEQATALDEIPADARSWAEVVRLDSGAGASLQRTIALLAEEAMRPRSALASGPARAHAEALLTSVFVEAGAVGPPSGRRSHRAAPRCVRRAMELMAAHLEDPLTPAQIVAASGVSLRTLYAAFATHVGVPPMQWLRARRLDAVHRALSLAEPGATAVTEVALRFGFIHLGRFAAQYRARFGEPPSATLARPTRPR